MIIIENLKTKDTTTGKQLYDDLKYPVLSAQCISIEFHNPKTPGEFKDLLEKIKLRCTNSGCYPWLHIEIHGNYKGLVFGDSEENLDWCEVKSLLSAINNFTQFNLFLSLAVCYGAKILHQIKDMNSVAPFMGCFASEEKVKEGTVYAGFYNFFDEFFRSFDIYKAEAKFKTSIPNTGFKIYRVEELFIKAYLQYLKNGLQKQIVEQRWQALVQSKMVTGNRKARSKQKKKYMENLYNEEFNRKFFDEMRSKYFGIENLKHFSEINYDSVMELSKV
ncbi:MAG: hypothetical protein JXA16_12500 [Bacteroidales bacterium]|nr:hypothetical protein [Bacteroidales bacterium]